MSLDSFRTIFDYFGLFSNYLGLFRIIFRLFWTISDYFGKQHDQKRSLAEDTQGTNWALIRSNVVRIHITLALIRMNSAPTELL